MTHVSILNRVAHDDSIRTRLERSVTHMSTDESMSMYKLDRSLYNRNAYKTVT